MAERVPVYAELTVAWGREVAEIVSGEDPSVLGGAMTSDTAGDACMVCVFCTWSWTVAGLARLLLPIVPATVLASTDVVANGVPFQRMAACAGKFVPMTLRVMACEPAVIVFGRTWVILGVAADCCVGPFVVVRSDPQPRQ